MRKLKHICTHSEVDITIVFGTIMPSSSLGGCTINPFSRAEFSVSPSHFCDILGCSSDFVSLDFFSLRKVLLSRFLFTKQKNRTPKLRQCSFRGSILMLKNLSFFCLKSADFYEFSTNL